MPWWASGSVPEVEGREYACEYTHNRINIRCSVRCIQIVCILELESLMLMLTSLLSVNSSHFQIIRLLPLPLTHTHTLWFDSVSFLSRLLASTQETDLICALFASHAFCMHILHIPYMNSVRVSKLCTKPNCSSTISMGCLSVLCCCHIFPLFYFLSLDLFLLIIFITISTFVHWCAVFK